MEPTDFVCKLEVADIPRRTRLLEMLVPQVVAHRREDRILNIDVPAAAEEIVREFVAEESKCCSFFSGTELERRSKGLEPRRHR